jgi:hypothetical protein
LEATNRNAYRVLVVRIVFGVNDANLLALAEMYSPIFGSASV